jgi:hypothetical protein
MKLARHVINRWWIFWPVVALYVALWSLPASVWFDSRSIQVSDSVVGEAPLVAEDRAVRWSFTGEYSATTRNAMTGEVARGCSGSEVLRYRGGLEGVDTMNLVDWTAGKTACSHLAPGRYYTETCRTVLYPLWGILPAKTRCWTSNIFTVRAEAGG